MYVALTFVSAQPSERQDIMKNNRHAAPHTADTFRIVPVVQTDGRAMKIPVEMTEQPGPIDAEGRVLHIVMTKNAFCAWRSSGEGRGSTH
jgi:hypothetical protein